MSGDWSETHRPRNFSEVVGQSDAVEALRALVGRGKRANLALTGPYGTGKTTLARLYAQAINCLAPCPCHRPCSECEACADVLAKRRGDYMEYNSRTEVDLEELQRLRNEVLCYNPPGPLTTRAFFFDEAQGLSRAVSDGLLTLMQEPPTPAVFIFAAIEREQLPLALISRCLSITTKPLDDLTAINLLEAVSRKEGLIADRQALSLIVQVSRHGRDLVKNLERVALSEGRCITNAGVQRALVNDRIARMVSYFLALADGDLDAQLRTIEHSSLLPGEVVETIQQFLTYLRLKYLGPVGARPPVLYRFLDLVGDDNCLRIVAAFRERAEAAQTSFQVLFDEMMEFWAYTPAVLTRAVVNLQLVRFHDLATAHRSGSIIVEPAPRLTSTLSQAHPDLAAGIGSSRRFRLPAGGRRARAAKANGNDVGTSSYLSEQQVRVLYEASTYLPQVEGVLFNTHLVISWSDFGVEGDKTAAALCSRLAHELGLRLATWGLGQATAFHRVILHERAEGVSDAKTGLISRLVCHVPTIHLERLERWLKESFLPRLLSGSEAVPAVPLDIERRSNKAVQQHWKLMRLLWRGLDPRITVDMRDGTRPPLVSVLGVTARDQRPIGEIDCRRFTISESINEGAQRKAIEGRMGHLSVFADSGAYGRLAWNALTQGWELKEYKERVVELAERHAAEEAIRTTYWAPNDQLYNFAYHAKMKAEYERQATHPHRRIRRDTDWCWWQRNDG